MHGCRLGVDKLWTGGLHWVVKCVRGAGAAADVWSILLTSLIGGKHLMRYEENTEINKNSYSKVSLKPHGV